MIKYTEDFVARVKMSFPEHSQLHWLLDSNSTAVGRILDEATDDRVTEEEVLIALDSEATREALRIRCLEIRNKITLYSEWAEMYNQYIDQQVETEN